MGLLSLCFRVNYNGDETGNAAMQTAVPYITHEIKLSLIVIFVLNANTAFFPINLIFVINSL